MDETNIAFSRSRNGEYHTLTLYRFAERRLCRSAIRVTSSVPAKRIELPLRETSSALHGRVRTRMTHYTRNPKTRFISDAHLWTFSLDRRYRNVLKRYRRRVRVGTLSKTPVDLLTRDRVGRRKPKNNTGWAILRHIRTSSDSRRIQFCTVGIAGTGPPPPAAAVCFDRAVKPI